jgi:hypothetical protein
MATFSPSKLDFSELFSLDDIRFHLISLLDLVTFQNFVVSHKNFTFKFWTINMQDAKLKGCLTPIIPGIADYYHVLLDTVDSSSKSSDGTLSLIDVIEELKRWDNLRKSLPRPLNVKCCDISNNIGQSRYGNYSFYNNHKNQNGRNCTYKAANSMSNSERTGRMLRNNDGGGVNASMNEEGDNDDTVWWKVNTAPDIMQEISCHPSIHLLRIKYALLKLVGDTNSWKYCSSEHNRKHDAKIAQQKLLLCLSTDMVHLFQWHVTNSDNRFLRFLNQLNSPSSFILSPVRDASGNNHDDGDGGGGGGGGDGGIIDVDVDDSHVHDETTLQHHLLLVFSSSIAWFLRGVIYRPNKKTSLSANSAAVVVDSSDDDDDAHVLSGPVVVRRCMLRGETLDRRTGGQVIMLAEVELYPRHLAQGMQMNGSGIKAAAAAAGWVDQDERRSRGVHTFNECPVVLKFTAKAKW